MKKIKLLKTTKVNGTFVAGETILEIGKDITKEEAEKLVGQTLATENLDVAQIASATVAKDSEIENLKKQIDEKPKK